ncbi:MAG: T9SS type A sorting domain-containing protein [Saprospiraceae bacterium]|nr:T9SS type A sorting domain-containing protein [Saprospiraceae bacterium]
MQELFTTVSVDVYPNPVSEYIYVKLDEENIIPKLAISSIDGKQIKIITGNKIRVEELPNGLYFCRFG